MWVTRLRIVDWVYSKTLTLLATLKTRNQPPVRVLCIFGSRTFVSISWMCKKQTSVSHSSTESEIMSLDAGKSMDGLLALDLRDTVIEVLRWNDNTVKPGHDSIRDISAGQNPKTKTPTDKRKQKVDQVSDVDYVPTNTHILLKVSLSCTFLKTIKLSSKWLSNDKVQRWDTCPEPTGLRLIGCLTGSDPSQKCWHQKQLADMLTKVSFTRDEWNHLHRWFNIRSFSVSRCSLVAISVIFFLIRSESREACQKEVKRRLQVKVHRWRNQNQ